MPLTSAVRTSKEAGFSLLEIMMVLAIFAAIVSLATPRLFRKDKNIRSAARQMLVLSKEVRNRARLSNSSMRIAFELGKSPGVFWVERANGLQPLNTPESAEREKRIKERSSNDKSQENSPWQKDTVLIKTQKSLPDGLAFGMVESVNQKDPQTEGTAYIHYFPEGSVEPSLLQITDGKNLTWSLVFNSLTGQIDIIESSKHLREIQR